VCANNAKGRHYIEPNRRQSTRLCQDCSNEAGRQRVLKKHGFETWAGFMKAWRATLGADERQRQWREQKRRSRKAHRERDHKRRGA
jgi:hypothetical protein